MHSSQLYTHLQVGRGGCGGHICGCERAHVCCQAAPISVSQAAGQACEGHPSFEVPLSPSLLASIYRPRKKERERKKV